MKLEEIAQARARANREVARMLDKAVEVCTEAQFTAAEEWLVLCLQTRHRDEAEDVIRWLRECFAEARALKKARAS